MQELEPVKDFLASHFVEYSEHEPMSLHTTFKIGGTADLYAVIPSVSLMCETLAYCQERQIPCFVLGGGSNLLVSDTGIRGVVISTEGLDRLSCSGGREIVCGAGVKLSRLCAFALENSLTGLEFVWGIPGTAGGAAYMNAGAYGGEMKDVVVSCRYITSDGQLAERTADELEYAYRHSVFMDNGGIITDMTLRLSPDDPELIRMKMDDLLERRKDKQPMNMPSAGSVFKRPEGYFAGTLIDQCELKGYAVGGAKVSEKHAGFIVNTGGATSSDVRRLIEHIREDVFLKTGVRLECEIRLIK